MSSREKDQADFDLERIMDLFDTALTSRDERVQNALRSLLMISVLTQTQDDGNMAIEQSVGPLRRMQEDLKNLNYRLASLQSEVDQLKLGQHRTYNPYPGGYSDTGGYEPKYGPTTLTGSVTAPAIVSLTSDEHDVILDYRNTNNTTI